MENGRSSSIDAIPVFLRFYRWLALLLAFLSILFTKNKDAYLINPYLLFSLVFIYTALLDFFHRSLYEYARSRPLILSIDVFVCITLIIASSYFNGSWTSGYFLYSIAPVMLGAYLFKVKGWLIIAGFFGLMDFILYFLPEELIKRPVVPFKISYLIADVVSYYLAGLFLTFPSVLLDRLNKSTIFLENTKNELIKVNKDLKKTNNQLLILQEACVDIHSQTDIKNILELTLGIVVEELGFDKTAIGLLDEKEEIFKEWVFSKNVSSEEIEKLNQFNQEKLSLIKDSVMKKAIEEKRIFKPEDIFIDKDFNAEKKKNAEMAPYVILPLIVLNKCIGVMLVGNMPKERQKLENDISILKALANQTATAIYSILAYVEKEKEIEKLSAVYDASLAIVSKKETTDLLKTMADYVKNFTQAEEVVYTYESEPENNLNAMGIFPLVVRGRPKGFLRVNSSSIKYFSESSINAIKILIAQTEVALECAELNRQAQEMIISNERILVGQTIHKDIIDSLFGVVLELEEDKKKISSDPDFVMKSFVGIEQRVKKSLEDLRDTIFKLREN